ncbi:hypothetical protein [Ruegeria arenilitoris]|uniref:hypothetical protein n=1 Tax=Ruegeria arenilitoris TaxID=1173585 RepID=UPI00147E0BCC|nr:hypothetical protein [Ruegeria arenilitoris]
MKQPTMKQIKELSERLDAQIRNSEARIMMMEDAELGRMIKAELRAQEIDEQYAEWMERKHS